MFLFTLINIGTGRNCVPEKENRQNTLTSNKTLSHKTFPLRERQLDQSIALDKAWTYLGAWTFLISKNLVRHSSSCQRIKINEFSEN